MDGGLTGRRYRRQTELVRGGLDRSQFRETSEGLFLTSGYVYDSAEQAEASFKGETDNFMYSRYANPTVGMFEERLARLEGAEDCRATSSGMAAIFSALGCFLGQGKRIVASRALFGSCYIICSEILPRFGVSTTFVDGHDLDQWASALKDRADAVFVETPSNPMLDLVDLEVVSALAHGAGAKVVVDNVFATPMLQRPLELGADIVTYSATKHIDGQGRTMGGAVLGSKKYIKDVFEPFYRHTGPSMSPFNAWIMVKGLETLPLRVERMCDNADRIARFLEGHGSVQSVRYPGLESHPQHDLAKRQMSGFGTLVTFTLPGGKTRAFDVLNRLRLWDISNNLGDAKSLVTHPATTTHQRLKPEERAHLGIDDGTVRLSVGLEDVEDLLEDLDAALA
ncbi:MAG: O-succinylhomoserine sulfhydrylase [Alphaproteobacteria bacterium]|nr:O-succinylhomoserine sulfhydrylase [Alphaproteobacteria bacterium]MBO6861482.1 O-succinylhomoserine sulfhydrylase [Alphaproteobacteria bacterium]